MWVCVYGHGDFVYMYEIVCWYACMVMVALCTYMRLCVGVCG